MRDIRRFAGQVGGVASVRLLRGWALTAALCLVVAVPAAAQTIWSGTLTVHEDRYPDYYYYGCDNVKSPSGGPCWGQIPPREKLYDFEYDNVEYDIDWLWIEVDADDVDTPRRLALGLSRPLPDAVRMNGTLTADGRTLAFSDAAFSEDGDVYEAEWSSIDFTWAHDQTVSLTITASAQPPLPAPAGVGLAAGDGQVTLSWSAVTGAASYEYQQKTLASGSCGTEGYGDWTSAGDRSPFTVPGLANGTRYCFRVRARNSSGPGAPSEAVDATPAVPTTTPPTPPTPPTSTTPTVSLSVAPNPVAEGGSATVTATLSSALPNGVTIPLTLTAGSAEPEDYGALSAIAIDSGSTTGTGAIATSQDADTEDETFTVALGNLPAAVTAGSPGSVVVTISDDEAVGPAAPTVSLSVSFGTVAEGSAVTITVTAAQAVGADTEVRLVRDTASTAGDDDFRFDAPQTGVATILAGDTVGTVGLTITDDDLVEGDESLTLNGLVGGIAVGSVTLVIEDGDRRTWTLSGGATDGNLVEGMSYELTATASPAVEAATTVEIRRDPEAGATGAAGDDDFTVELIVIEAGETTGTAMLKVTADDRPDGGTGTNRGETLVLVAFVEGTRVGDALTFTLWDAAVPALPAVAQLLLAALLAVGGRRYLRRRR